MPDMTDEEYDTLDEVPASHRLTIDVLYEIPAGRTVLIFKPVPNCPPV